MATFTTYNRNNNAENISMNTTADRAVYMLEAKHDELINDGWNEWKEISRNFNAHKMYTVLRKGNEYIEIIVKF